MCYYFVTNGQIFKGFDRFLKIRKTHKSKENLEFVGIDFSF
jgi:hypothetical protein